MKSNSYEFDTINTVLTITKDFARKASQLNSPEYKTMLQIRRDYPTVEIVMKEGKKGHSPASVSFKQMAKFIDQCRDAASRKDEFERVKALSKVQPCPYMYVKNWFMTNYASYSETPDFDAEGYVIVKTRAEMEQEAAANKEDRGNVVDFEPEEDLEKSA